MRFVFITLGYHPDLEGGAFRYAAAVAEGLAARGHEVHAVFPNPRNALPATGERHGVHLHRVPDGTGSFLANWRQENRAVREVLATLGADRPGTLVGSHHGYFEPALRGFRPTAFFHGPWGHEYAFGRRTPGRPWTRRLLDGLIARRLHATERRALARAGRILVASRYIEGRLREWHPGLAAPVEVVGGGVDLEAFRPPVDRPALRRRWGLGDDDFLFLTVRRLDPRMGLRPLLEAFGRMAARVPRARLWMAGRGPQSAELEAQARELGLADRVRLTGFVPEEDLPGLYGAADCTLMPSLDLEGFGLVTAESLACGTPVVAAPTGANPEVLRPLDPGLVQPLTDADAGPAVLESLANGTRALPDRNRCRAHAGGHFRWDTPVAAFERAADGTADGRGRT